MRLWKTRCEQLSEYDSIISAKDGQLEWVRARVDGNETSGRETRAPGSGDPHVTPFWMGPNGTDPMTPRVAPARRGKAHPVNSFNGDNLLRQLASHPGYAVPPKSVGSRRQSVICSKFATHSTRRVGTGSGLHPTA